MERDPSVWKKLHWIEHRDAAKNRKRFNIIWIRGTGTNGKNRQDDEVNDGWPREEMERAIVLLNRLLRPRRDHGEKHSGNLSRGHILLVQLIMSDDTLSKPHIDYAGSSVTLQDWLGGLSRFLYGVNGPVVTVGYVCIVILASTLWTRLDR